jgi:hypothetical protein
MKQLPAGNSLAFAQITESHSDPIRLTRVAEQILRSLRHVVKSIPEKKSSVLNNPVELALYEKPA